jgi:hypothetical protein
MSTVITKQQKSEKQNMKNVYLWIQANKKGKIVAKRDLLKMLEVMERDGNTIKDAIEELKRLKYD